jgi:hypothetical protein
VAGVKNFLCTVCSDLLTRSNSTYLDAETGIPGSMKKTNALRECKKFQSPVNGKKELIYDFAARSTSSFLIVFLPA